VAARLNQQNLGNSLWAFSTLGLYPGDPALDAIQLRAAETVEEFNVQVRYQRP
jgi:hypothetical protein